MTYQPGHGRPHTRFARACARLSRGLAWVYDHTAGVFHYQEDWAEPADDNGEPLSDLVGDVELPGPDGWPEDDGRSVTEAVRDAEAAEARQPDGIYKIAGEVSWEPLVETNVPGPVGGQASEPGHIQAVLLRDGTLLRKTPAEPPAYDPREIDDTIINLRPEPRSGAAAWATQLRRARRTWAQDLIEQSLGAPTVEIYLWNWQQRRALTA